MAARLLADWDEAVQRFVKVMPHDYRRALESGAVSTGGEGFFTRETETEDEPETEGAAA